MRLIHMLSTRGPLQMERHTHIESEGIEKGISYKWK